MKGLIDQMLPCLNLQDIQLITYSFDLYKIKLDQQIIEGEYQFMTYSFDLYSTHDRLIRLFYTNQLRSSKLKNRDFGERRVGRAAEEQAE